MPFTLDQLQNGDNQVVARFSRRDNEDGDAPDWSPPKNVTLRIQRRTKTVRQGKRVYPAGQIISVYVTDFDWAEYAEDQYENGTFMAEEYRMQIIQVGHQTDIPCPTILTITAEKLEERMLIAEDTKKHLWRNKSEGKWYWCQRDQTDSPEAQYCLLINGCKTTRLTCQTTNSHTSKATTKSKWTCPVTWSHANAAEDADTTTTQHSTTA